MKRRKRKAWSEVDVQLLREKYHNSLTSDLAIVFKRPMHQVHAKARKLGLAKDPAFVAKVARERTSAPDHPSHRHRFPKGHEPANKGTRRPGYAPGNMALTQFKKGIKPHSYAPIGSTRINSDGYLDRKISDTGYPPDDWKGVHRLVWIQAHGPIPPGHRVAFKPGRRTTVEADITVDALELVTPAEMMRRNTLHNLPKELKEVVQLRGRVVRAINKRAKANE